MASSCRYHGTPYVGGQCATCAEIARGVRAPALPAQLDMDGGSHEIARPSERLRLFEPAPAQLEGQSFLTDAELER